MHSSSEKIIGRTKICPQEKVIYWKIGDDKLLIEPNAHICIQELISMKHFERIF